MGSGLTEKTFTISGVYLSTNDVTISAPTNFQRSIPQFPQYGQFDFQGVYVYQIDAINGFNLKGQITHLSGNNDNSENQYAENIDENISRAIYINDLLYTVSNSKIMANNLLYLREIDKILIP